MGMLCYTLEAGAMASQPLEELVCLSAPFTELPGLHSACLVLHPGLSAPSCAHPAARGCGTGGVHDVTPGRGTPPWPPAAPLPLPPAPASAPTKPCADPRRASPQLVRSLEELDAGTREKAIDAAEARLPPHCRGCAPSSAAAPSGRG